MLKRPTTIAQRPLSPLVHERVATPISRRRWCAAVGATALSTLVGCDADNAFRAAGVSRPASNRPADPLTAAGEWLAARQSVDGGWHSADYAQLKTGPALTAIVRFSLSRFVESDAGRMRCPGLHLRPMWLLRQSIDAFLASGSLDYPNYTASLVLRVLAEAKQADDSRRIDLLVAYLVDQQFREAGGFSPEHPAYGGWGYGGPRPVGGSPGHMDIAHTRHVLEALRAAGHDVPDTYRRAERFLRLMQKHPTEDRPHPSTAGIERPKDWKPPYDGGFFFSPIVLAANKAGEAKHGGQPYFRSYATATCEGILALLACGVPRDDERIQSAVDWLKRHPRLDYPEGIPPGPDVDWAASIRFYHFAVRAQCYAALDGPGPWREELRKILAGLQQPDGSFINREGFLMKEDDPILCTALAVIALSK